MPRRSTISLILVLAAACASSSSSSRAPASSGSPNVIGRAELDAAGSITAYDAVLRLRPAFLRGRGPTSLVNESARTVAVVFVNDVEYGDLESLKRFPASRIEQIVYFNGPEAVTKFGGSYGSGVIVLKPRSQ